MLALAIEFSRYRGLAPSELNSVPGADIPSRVQLSPTFAHECETGLLTVTGK